MSAPKGNEFWKARTKHGRDRLFGSSDALEEACVEYFEWVEDNPLYTSHVVAFQGSATLKDIPKMRAMTIAGLCNFLNISQETWRTWKSEEAFSVVVTRVNNIIYQQKFEGAAAELLNPNIIARDLGLSDKASVDHTSSDGSMSHPLNTEKLSTEAIKELLAARESASPDTE